MPSSLHFQSVQKLDLRPSFGRQEDVYRRIERWWHTRNAQDIQLANAIPGRLEFPQPGEMIFKCNIQGLECWTQNHVRIVRRKGKLKVHIWTHQPSLLLQSLWNVWITYTYCETTSQLILSYRKTITSSAPCGCVQNFILNQTYEQQELDTDIVAQSEAQNVIALFSYKFNKTV